MAKASDTKRTGSASLHDTGAPVDDEPGMAERFQRGLRNLINTPPKPRKPKEQSVGTRHTHKSKKRS